MKKKQAADSKKVSRRDFTKTSVAAVALTGLLGCETAPSRMKSAGGMNAAGGMGSAAGGMGSAAVEPEASTGKSAAIKHPSGWKEGTTIPAEYYLDPKHYQNDEAYLADNFWFMVDHESRIPNAGDYFTFEFGRGDNIIIVRDDKMKVNAFHNVCRHRGSRLCRDSDDPRPEGARLSVLQLSASGNTPLFRCPYHGWTYDLEGNLTKAYKMQEDFDLSKNGLSPCHLRVEGGHIFINMTSEDKPPDFEEATRRFRGLAEKYGLADLKIGVRQSYFIKANWKLAIENFLECYHCGASHQCLVTTHNWDERLTEEEEAFRNEEVKAWVNEESSGYGGSLNPGFVTGSLDGKPVAPLLPNRKEWSHTTDLTTTGYSTGYWQAYDDHVAVARFTPRDAELTDCEIFWLVHPDAVEGKDFDAANVMALWDITIREDIWIVENNHMGIKSRSYGPGRYAGNESSPANFIKWYMTEVVKA